MTARCYIGPDQGDESEKTYPSGASGSRWRRRCYFRSWWSRGVTISAPLRRRFAPPYLLTRPARDGLGDRAGRNGTPPKPRICELRREDPRWDRAGSSTSSTVSALSPSRPVPPSTAASSDTCPDQSSPTPRPSRSISRARTPICPSKLALPAAFPVPAATPVENPACLWLGGHELQP